MNESCKQSGPFAWPILSVLWAFLFGDCLKNLKNDQERFTHRNVRASNVLERIVENVHNWKNHCIHYISFYFRNSNFWKMIGNNFFHWLKSQANTLGYVLLSLRMQDLDLDRVQSFSNDHLYIFHEFTKTSFQE